MSQFTRSILYSTAVIALGLAAVIAIYSDMQTNTTDVTMIEPAAGEETVVLEQTTFESELPAEDGMMDNTADATQQKAEEILAEIETIIQEASDEADAAAAANDMMPAAGHEEHGEEAMDEAHDEHEHMDDEAMHDSEEELDVEEEPAMEDEHAEEPAEAEHH